MWMSLPFEKCIQKVKTPFKLPKKEYLEQGRYPVVSQEAALISGYHDDANHLFNVDQPVVIFGDHTQVLKYIDFSFVMGADGVKILKPIRDIDAKYFFYALTTLMPKGKGYARHYKLLKELNISFPPLAEQQRIVAKLDAAFAEIDRAVEVVSEQLRNSSDVYSTILTEKLNRLEKDTKLDECCSFLNGYAFKSNEAVEETDVQLLRMGNLYNNVLDLERKPVFYPSEFAQNYSKYVINSGDIVMTLTGTVGKQDYGYAIKVPETDRTLLLNQRILKLHNFDDSRVNQDFLLYVLRSQSFLSELYSTANGTRQANLSSETIKNLKIPLPSIITQNELVRSLQSIELASTAYFDAINQKATELSSLKSAMLAQELQQPQSEAA
jgi:type I restriction enzyme, S subunit